MKGHTGMYVTALVCFVFFLRLDPIHGFNEKHGYMLTIPNELHSGGVAKLCVSLFNWTRPATVSFVLLLDGKDPPTKSTPEEVLCTTNGYVDKRKCFLMKIPHTEEDHGRLRFTIKWQDADLLQVWHTKVYIKQNTLLGFVETDKPVYKPGQNVNIRALILKHDLTPCQEPIPRIWIETPSNVRVVQWTNVSTTNGMAQLKFPLSTEPNLGIWKVKMEKSRQYSHLLETTNFEVKEYVLPRYELTIRGPEKIMFNEETIKWDICAKYTYGKPVKGKLHVAVDSYISLWSREKSAEIIRDMEINSPDGCTKLVLSSKDLHLEKGSNHIKVMANFTESGTGVKETASGNTNVIRQPLELSFTEETDQYYKPNIAFHAQLKVTRYDKTPVANQIVKVCARMYPQSTTRNPKPEECRNFKSSSKGLIELRMLPESSTSSMWLTAEIEGDKSIRWNNAYASTSAKSWYSPSNSFLDISKTNKPLVCGKEYEFFVTYTKDHKDSWNTTTRFEYMINSKDGLIGMGEVKHVGNINSLVNYNNIKDLWTFKGKPCVNKHLRTHKFPIKIKITNAMAPVSKLLIYYVRSNGEVVAAHRNLNIGPCFANKVKGNWNESTQKPGSKVNYHLSAAPLSLCGISSVDKSTLLLGSSNLLNAKQVYDHLNRFVPSVRFYNSWNHRRCNPQMTTKIAGILPRYRIHEYVDATRAFEESGVVMLTNLTAETRPCQRYPPMPFAMYSKGGNVKMAAMNGAVAERAEMAMAANVRTDAVNIVQPEKKEENTLRSYFPETWLWDLVPVGEKGEVTLHETLPHTITDWVTNAICISPKQGLGIAPETTIKAFQPFFLDYTLPYSVKRGEVLHLKVSLFNYMDYSLPVKIRLENAKGFDVISKEVVASFWVKSRDNVVHEYILKPRILGQVNITVSGVVDDSKPCKYDAKEKNTRDVIVKPILVLPEGFPIEVTESAFVCPSDIKKPVKLSWNIKLPTDLVIGSERTYVTVTGDVLGPVFENLGNLVRLPTGCGEQNMITLVPNIHVLGYMDAAGINSPAIRAKAISHMETGYQRQLSYRHWDGSYSAFGYEKEGSIWLTAFVVKSFVQAQRTIFIDQKDLKMSADWIVSKQKPDGCFPNVGTVIHQDMKGGLKKDESTIGLSAYILITLIESHLPFSEDVIPKALSCIKTGIQTNSTDTYTLALYTYALTLLKHQNAAHSMKQLLDRANVNANHLWWVDKAVPSTEVSIEITAYAVLSLLNLGGEQNKILALKAVRWMCTKRNAQGGFVSTQDTVLGLEALARYAGSINVKNTNLIVTVDSKKFSRAEKINNDNRLVVNEIRLPVLPTNVSIVTKGEGCALVQCITKYNVAKTKDSEMFDISVDTAPVKAPSGQLVKRIKTCVSYKSPNINSNMAILEIGMVSGYKPEREDLANLLKDPSTGIKRYDINHDVVTIYFEKLTSKKVCVEFMVKQEHIVDNPKPANVKIYDYYRQDCTKSISYDFCATTKHK